MEAAINKLSVEKRKAADEALNRLRQFSGDMGPNSGDAALLSAFLHSFTIRTFGDELGYPDDLAWKAFLTLSPVSYSAIQDHLLQRDESPFWDDVSTPSREAKADIIAAALADSIAFLEAKLGKDRAAWQWGKLHTYFWETDGSKVANQFGGFDKFAFRLLGSFFNYGPLPAGGDHATLNTATYTIGASFDTLEIPAMRLVVDFSQEEPMMALNSSGQSSNPASPHYVYGIAPWLEGRYQPFPFESTRLKQHYGQTRTLVP